MPVIIDHFDALTERGLKVIPLRKNSKIPLCKGWTNNWNKTKVREKLAQFPKSNIGILLGDIVDVEGDSESANQTVIELIGSCPHPCYHSSKSIHHLFLNPDPNFRHFRWEAIEFRGYGHQSVLPPSQHAGIQYRWSENFRFPVPEMPERLLSFFHAKRHKHQTILKKNHLKVRCADCGRKCFIHEKRFSLELKAFKLLSTKWKCHNCRMVDLRPACRLIRRGLISGIILQ